MVGVTGFDSRLRRSPLRGALAVLARPKSLRDFVNRLGWFHPPDHPNEKRPPLNCEGGRFSLEWSG